MSECDCEHARANLEELIRGELCDTDSAPISEHLKNCPDCRDEQQVFHKLTDAVRRACDGPAPASLRETIIAQLRELN